MKNLLFVILLILLAHQVQANHDHFNSEGNQQSFSYYGQREVPTIKLFDIREVWNRELQTIYSTCERQRAYQVRVCRQDSRNSNAHRRHRTYGVSHHGIVNNHHSCRMTTRYRTIRYSCPKQEYVRVRKPDQRFHGNVRFRFFNKDHYAYSSDSLFKVSLRNDQLTVSVKDQHPLRQNIYLAKVRKTKHHQGKLTTLNATYDVQVFNKEKFLSPLNLPLRIVPHLKRDTFLVLRSGSLFYPEILSVKLRITTPRGEQLFNQKVPTQLLKIAPSKRNPERSNILIDLKRLLGDLRNYHSLNITAQLGIDKENFTVLNSGFVPSLKVNQRQTVSTY